MRQCFLPADFLTFMLREQTWGETKPTLQRLETQADAKVVTPPQTHRRAVPPRTTSGLAFLPPRDSRYDRHNVRETL